MTDRELLELAAKAAGYANAEWKEYSNAPPTMTVPYDKPVGGITGFLWNPLTDDGDCARLEANLGIDVQWLNKSVTCQRLAAELASVSLLFSSYGGDRSAARRYASVMCAAEIGRAMQ